MKYAIDRTNAFKRDYKRVKKRGLDLNKLKEVVAKLANGETLPPANRDHPLSGEWANHRECHIAPDWLLIYQIKDDVLVLTLTRTGTHADLFCK
ncbi:MAG: type II toxin-antitoxin system YafQ family toxin [Kiritimatiellae bacterium]|nr:type II toxin-antitoxin system YafQ family toxin [Kiritimatiellia bacterium]